MKTNNRKIYAQPQIGFTTLSDDIMHWGSYYVDGEHGNTEYNDDDDAEGQDAKHFDFDWNAVANPFEEE